MRFGIRLHMITRDTAEEAWRQARPAARRRRRGDDPQGPGGPGHQRVGGAAADAGAARRQSATAWRSTRTCGPGSAWSAAAPGTALVGSHTEVADRIEEYAALGIDEFILSGYPHLEEAYWFGEGVLPILAARGVWQHPAPEAADGTVNATPFAPTSGSAPAAAS